MLMDYIQEWKNNMWIHVVASDKKLYQDGKEVKEITLDGAIIEIVHNSNGVWLKIKE